MNSNNFFDLAVNLLAFFAGLVPSIMFVACLITGKLLAALVLLIPIVAIVAFIFWYNGYSLKDWIWGLFSKKKV
jgi:energy-coupling factor transporter transmembrane protein EcfT